MKSIAALFLSLLLQIGVPLKAEAASVFESLRHLLQFKSEAADSARPGDLDPAFGHKGTVITELNIDEARAVVIQEDGKIVVAGYVNQENPLLVDYARAAAEDTRALADFPHLNPSLIDFAIVRYLPDGRRDISFGRDGGVVLDFHNDVDKAHALVLQKDGKIVVGGEAVNTNNHSFDFALVRLNRDGSLDETFGRGGEVLTDFLGANHDKAYGLALQENGKILAVGETATSGDNPAVDFALARYNPNGSLDDTFGTNGKVTLDFIGGIDIAQAVHVHDRRIFVAGRASTQGNSGGDFGIACFQMDGTLDSSFGTAGKTTTVFGGGNAMAHALLVESDGKIVLAGYTASALRKSGAMVRYNPQGAPDPTFGSNSIVTTSFGGDYDCVYALARQQNGKIIAAGHSLAVSGEQTKLIAVARFNSDGIKDPTFGNDGVKSLNLDDMSASAYAVALQKDGQIIAAGTSGTGSRAHFMLMRFISSSGDHLNLEQALPSVQNVANGDFSIAIWPNSKSTKRIKGIKTLDSLEEKCFFDIIVTATPGFSDTVNLSVSGLPPGATGKLLLTAIAGSGTNSLQIICDPYTPVGNFILTVTGTSSGSWPRHHSASASLSITNSF